MKQSSLPCTLLSIFALGGRASSHSSSCYLTSTIIYRFTGASFSTSTSALSSPSATSLITTSSDAPGFGTLTTFLGSSAEQSLASVQSSELGGVPIGRTSTSSISTTTSAAGSPTSSASRFYISVNVNTAPPRLQKRLTEYVAFNGDDGVLVDSQSAAALFELVNGYLMSGGEFVGADSSEGYSAFKRSLDPPADSQGWSSGGGDVTFGDATFCEANNGSVYIILTASPAFPCGDVAPAAVLAPSTSTLTTTSELTSLIASSTQEITTTPFTTAMQTTIESTASEASETLSSTATTIRTPPPLSISSSESVILSSKALTSNVAPTSRPLGETTLTVMFEHNSAASASSSSSLTSTPILMSSTNIPALTAQISTTSSAGYQPSTTSGKQTTRAAATSSGSSFASASSTSVSQPTTSALRSSTAIGQPTTSAVATSPPQLTTSSPSSNTALRTSSSLTTTSELSSTTSIKPSTSTTVLSSTSASQKATTTTTSTLNTSTASLTPSIPAGVPVRDNGKRGLAYTNVTQTQFYSLSGQNSQVSWCYDYYSLPNASDNVGATNPALIYVPLLYNNADSLTSIWAGNVNYSIANYGTDSILAFNEPDGCDGGKSACMTVAESVAGYQGFIQPFAGQVLLGAPAVTNSGPPAGLTYLSYFLGNCTGCQIDFIPIHWYASPYSFSYLQSYVQQAYATGGNRTIWITELGMDSQSYLDADVQTFMKNATTWLDAQSYVKRYSWFGDFEGYLLNADGTALSAQGVIWNNYTGGYVQ